MTKFTAKQYREYLQDCRSRIERQVGRRPITQTDRDQVEIACMTGLSVLRGARAMGDRSFEPWFGQNGFAEVFRNRHVTAFQKRWTRQYRRFFDLALSIIDLWPGMSLIDCPIDPPGVGQTSPAKLAALAKARVARWAQNQSIQSCTCSQSQTLTDEKSGQESSGKTGVSTAEIATLGERTDSGKSPPQRRREKQAAIAARRESEVIRDET